MAKITSERKSPRGVFERPKGSGIWWVLYYHNGKRYRERIGPKSLAIQVAEKRRTEIREGKFFPESVGRKKRKKKIDEMIAGYLELVKVEHRAFQDDRSCAKLWLAEFSGRTLESIEPADVERWKVRRLQQVKPATVARNLAWLKRFFNVAIRDGEAKRNPVVDVKMPAVNNARVRFLFEDEEGLLRGVMLPEDFAIVELAFNTGLRRGEQFGLEWEEVDFGNAILTIPRSKNGRKRHVPLNERALAILRALPSRMRSRWVFPSSTGERPMDPNNWINRHFRPAIEQAGIANFRYHDLRHTFASRLAMAGRDLYEIKELMGHRSISMTERYAHLCPSKLKEAVNCLPSWNRNRFNNPTATAAATGSIR